MNNWKDILLERTDAEGDDLLSFKVYDRKTGSLVEERNLLPEYPGSRNYSIRDLEDLYFYHTEKYVIVAWGGKYMYFTLTYELMNGDGGLGIGYMPMHPNTDIERVVPRILLYKS